MDTQAYFSLIALVRKCRLPCEENWKRVHERRGDPSKSDRIRSIRMNELDWISRAGTSQYTILILTNQVRSAFLSVSLVDITVTQTACRSFQHCTRASADVKVERISNYQCNWCAQKSLTLNCLKNDRKARKIPHHQSSDACSLS